MPPFGFENDRVGLLQPTGSVSFMTDEIDSKLSFGMGSQALKNLFQRFEEESIPIDLTCALQDLLQVATDFSDKVQIESSHHLVMSKAVNNSIRIVLTEVFEQVALLLDLEGDQRRVLVALVRSSIQQAFHYFHTLQSMVLKADTKKLEPFLQEFSEMEEECPPIRVSLLSRALAFEFMAGKMNTVTKVPSGRDGEMGLKVNATPYLVVKSDDISEECCLLHKYNHCKVAIDYCSHKKFFNSSGSGVMGEATVRIYVNPDSEVKLPKEGRVWGSSGDCEKLNIAEVRA